MRPKVSLSTHIEGTPDRRNDPHVLESSRETERTNYFRGNRRTYKGGQRLYRWCGQGEDTIVIGEDEDTKFMERQPRTETQCDPPLPRVVTKAEKWEQETKTGQIGALVKKGDSQE